MRQGAAAVAQVPSVLWAPFRAFGRKSMELSAFMHRKDVSDVRPTPSPHVDTLPVVIPCQGTAPAPIHRLHIPCTWP